MRLATEFVMKWERESFPEAPYVFLKWFEQPAKLFLSEGFRHIREKTGSSRKSVPELKIKCGHDFTFMGLKQSEKVMKSCPRAYFTTGLGLSDEVIITSALDTRKAVRFSGLRRTAPRSNAPNAEAVK